jgi:hypothetical protein
MHVAALLRVPEQLVVGARFMLEAHEITRHLLEVKTVYAWAVSTTTDFLPSGKRARWDNMEY